MNLFKKLRLWKELKRKRKIDALMDDQIIDAIERNKQLDKDVKKARRLQLLDIQQKKSLEALGIVEEEEEYEEEEEGEETEAQGLLKNLLVKGLNAPSQSPQSQTGFPLSDSTQPQKVAQNGSNALNDLFEKVKALPLAQQEKLIDLASSYL